MDVSDTISDRNFDREKKVIQGLVEAFEVKLDGSRAGLITFSTVAHTRAEIGQYDTAAAFNQVVGNLKQYGMYLFHRAISGLLTGKRRVGRQVHVHEKNVNGG